MSKKKTDTMTSAQKKSGAFLEMAREKSTPELGNALAQAGSIIALSEATGISTYAIQQAGKGIKPLDTKNQTKLDAYLNGEPMPQKSNTNPFEKPKEQPVTIPVWDKKMETVKFLNKTTGKKENIKMPALIAELFSRHGNVKNNVGRALGFSGYSGVDTALQNGKYESRLHARAYAAVNGLPLPTNGHGKIEEDVRDAFTLGIAICLVALSDFERREEIAEIMGGALIFKRTAGNTGWWAIYRIAPKDKLEKFKRLASRDAKKIVCP